MTTNIPSRSAPTDGRWAPVLSRPSYPELNKPEPEPEPEPVAEPSPEPATAPAPPPAVAPPKPAAHATTGRRFAMYGIAAATAAVAVAAISLAVQKATTPETIIVPAPPSPVAAPAPEEPGFAAGGPCAPITTPAKVRGNGPGGTDSGPSAILAFEHAYYATRSGAKAREVVTPDASVSPVETIQQGIDTVPVGTVHCVTITPHAEPGKFNVEIVARQQANSSSYRQIITTAPVEGRTLITKITSASS
ncbi:hypothetical protein [Nocardia camponoti]|uniref:DUF8176 domain-containing protein n=1 Tax=Nocardia camponoti TaxID=1616106 RepID=A0A917VEY4_9NOCA|nr:hypothetical protein [Nocardia camponoti]GGK68968.1 hypothetical protein GCM10011591_46360 [Nocardia camponoti]